MSPSKKPPRTSNLKYRGSSRANKLKFERIFRKLDRLEDRLDLMLMSDFLSGVAELPTSQQIKLLEYLKKEAESNDW